MAILFDPSTQRIVLDRANVTAAQIWIAWIDWVSLSDNGKYLPALKQVGGDNLGGGIFIPPYIFLLNGWRIRPMEQNHTFVITGNIFVDGGGDPVVSTLGIFRVLGQYTVPVQAQGISTGASNNSYSLSQIATAVRQELSPELAKIQNGMSLDSTQAMMLLEIYRLYGLDPTKPLIVTDTTRVVGNISQSINSNSNSTTITRL